MGRRTANLGVLSLKREAGRHKGALGRHLGWKGGGRSPQQGWELLKSLAKKQIMGQEEELSHPRFYRLPGCSESGSMEDSSLV